MTGPDSKTSCQSVDDAVRVSLDGIVDEIAAGMGSPKPNVISITGPMVYGLDTIVRNCVEKAEPSKRLVVLLTTTGGYVTPVERMVDTFRTYYEEVDFVIPDMAMSAGTIFALSGDRIWMDYFSILGPIDPQVQKDDRFVPALSYLSQFDRLVQLAEEGRLSAAHAILLQKLDLAELDQYAKERELSVTLLKKWLTAYKFKTWTTTESGKQAVTPEMKRQRAEEIARSLNDTEKWHTHSRGINKDTLEAEVRLRIDDLRAVPPLHSAVRNYHKILQDYLRRHGIGNFVHGKDFF